MTKESFEGFPASACQVFSANKVSETIRRMAGEIEADLKHLNPIVMPILIGGAFTAFITRI